MLLEFAQQTTSEENPAANNPRASFWGMVDNSLEQLRAAEHGSNNPWLVKEWVLPLYDCLMTIVLISDRFFTVALQLDLKKYSGQYPKLSQLEGPKWQKIVEQGAHFVPN